MNLEFQSAGKPTMNGLRGINAKAENPAASHSKRNEKSAQFKNLLDQSKQDLKQADRQLEKVRENQRETQSIAESKRRENEPKTTDDMKVKTDDSQSNVSVNEELKSEESHESGSLSTLDSAQLMGVQSFQGGIETALTQLNLKLGLEENMTPEVLVDQGSVIQLTDMNEPVENLPVLEGVPQFDEIIPEEAQIIRQHIGMIGSEKDVEVDGLQGQLKNEGIELVKADDQSNEVKYAQVVNNQAKKAGDDSESQAVDGISPMNEDNTEEIKSEKAESVIGGSASTEEQSSEKIEFKDIQSNPINKTENQNLGERGVQEINVTGISSNRGSEVQPNTNVEVAQQVQQKIIQNFEPNKPMVLQMTLSPDNLGDIDIKLSYNQGKLVIDITALSQETQNLLGKQINLLVRGLALQNVQVETVHLNTPVEQSSDGQEAAFTMNSGSDPNENQHQALLRERFIKNSGVLNSILTSSEEDESILIPQNLQNYSNHRVNYLV